MKHATSYDVRPLHPDCFKQSGCFAFCSTQNEMHVVTKVVSTSLQWGFVKRAIPVVQCIFLSKTNQHKLACFLLKSTTRFAFTIYVLAADVTTALYCVYGMQHVLRKDIVERSNDTFWQHD